MADYKSILAAALAEGKSIEDVMNEISAAANAIQAEKAAAAKYDNYNKPLDIEGSVFARRLGTADKISTNDAATVLAHYVCQNVQDYAAYCAKNDKDIIKSAVIQLNNYTHMAALEVKTDNKSDEEAVKIILDGVLDRLADVFIEAITEDETKPIPAQAKPKMADSDKIAEFFRKQGL